MFCMTAKKHPRGRAGGAGSASPVCLFSLDSESPTSCIAKCFRRCRCPDALVVPKAMPSLSVPHLGPLAAVSKDYTQFIASIRKGGKKETVFFFFKSRDYRISGLGGDLSWLMSCSLAWLASAECATWTHWGLSGGAWCPRPPEACAAGTARGPGCSRQSGCAGSKCRRAGGTAPFPELRRRRHRRPIFAIGWASAMSVGSVACPPPTEKDQ